MTLSIYHQVYTLRCHQAWLGNPLKMDVSMGDFPWCSIATFDDTGWYRWGFTDINDGWFLISWKKKVDIEVEIQFLMVNHHCCWSHFIDVMVKWPFWWIKSLLPTPHIQGEKRGHFHPLWLSYTYNIYGTALWVWVWVKNINHPNWRACEGFIRKITKVADSDLIPWFRPTKETHKTGVLLPNF